MPSPPSADPAERERVRREFFRLVLPSHLERTFVDFHRLFDFCDARHRDFKQAAGFPHAFIDRFLTNEGYETLLREIRGLDEAPVWDPHDAPAAPQLSAELYLPPAVRALLGELGMETFLAAMHSLTGIARLLPDPDRSEDGLFAIPTGSSHVPPVTPPRHPRLGLFRRTRLTLFLCDDWNDAWGGQLELRSIAEPAWSETIFVRPNRCVIWNTPQHARVAHRVCVAHPAGASLYFVAVTFYAAAPVAKGKKDA